MLFTGLGQSVWEKTVPEALSTALGLRPQAVLYQVICDVIAETWGKKF